MDIKVNGPLGTNKTDKKKKASSAGATGAAAFASMLNQASEGNDVASSAPVAGVAHVPGILVDEERGAPLVPSDPEERGAYMLTALEELEQDILSGSPTSAIEKLKQALATQSEGYNNLSAAQREIADEIALRASVEIAKIESN